MLYASESLTLTDSQLNQIDFFRGLRQILGVQSTFLDREMTNEKLLEMANNHKSKNAKEIIALSKIVKSRQAKYVGHIIREGTYRLNSPTIEITFDDLINLFPQKIRVKKRRGRPHNKLVLMVMDGIWNSIDNTDTPFNIFSDHQRNVIKTKAINKEFPF